MTIITYINILRIIFIREIYLLKSNIFYVDLNISEVTNIHISVKVPFGCSHELLKIEKQDLFILDDFGIQPLDAQSRASLKEIIGEKTMPMQFLTASFTMRSALNSQYIISKPSAILTAEKQ